ncbi:hypothetical protein BMI86_08835 [Thioclava sp. DLFJ5-1]|uniref:hypothetical protein n=1 Tax=Thioclava sp. DLFJ5-1 TaxID=1915314 RepID=UPI000996C1B7|nr:hypothetical protein [Thioclava sp. DLFJ5-1]OOY20626.1 hypothetical protein BMI86_08835 [Thioclava sp. DLFJ5-1]
MKASETSNLLLVDPARELPSSLKEISGQAIQVLQYDQITAQKMVKLRPELVLAPLLSERFDILDLAKRLEEFGFTGKLRAYSRPLPNIAAIRQEVRAAHPQLDFDIFTLPVGEFRDN